MKTASVQTSGQQQQMDLMDLNKLAQLGQTVEQAEYQLLPIFLWKWNKTMVINLWTLAP